MKKVLLATLLLVFAVGFSQPIAVSTTSHTVPQLVNNVLINSPCVEATNITWRTGTTFGSSNGIGYFQNTNPDFPMQAGVILSTGNAVNAAGPNTSMLNDGSTSWPGDAALQSTLAAAGITMTSVNASVLEFDFTPISSHFNFDFVFASEEYGNFQCQFSDAFAFLLTNMTTGVTTNLAVVPNTNTPISVVTIRDFLYNSSCPSANSQYFGTFNGGSAAAGSATNFNGQTKLLNASANLVPNTPYHIKLVIADRSDPQSDSAIFINSDSFNIGQDVLGLDLTVANNTAICYGQSYTLSTGLNPAQYTFSWTKDNVAISGATGPSINVTQPGNYGVTYTNIVNLCQPVTDHINVEYYPQVTSANPIDLYKCDMGAATYNYDLSVNTPIIKNGLDPAATVTYFASQANADSNASPLPTNYTAAPGTTIYVRVSVPNIPCYAVKIFHLLTSAPPVAHTLPDLMLCERSAIVHNNFVYTAPLVSQVLAGQSATVNNVSFYTSQANANSGTSPITVGFMLATTGTTVYVRVQNATDPSCYSTTSFNVTVNPLPPIDQMADVIVCDQYILPPLTNGNYFTGLNGTGTPLFAGNVITQTQTIYIYNQSTGPNSCAANTQFKVTIIKPNEISPAGGTFCGSYTLPPLPQGHYHTAAGGGGDIIPAGTVIDHTETIYFYFVTESEPFCVIDSGVDIVILNAPQLPAFANIIECNSYTLPSLPAGAHYFTQTGGGGTEIPAGSAITSTQDVYVYATGGNTAHPCISEAQFTVTIGLANPADITQCMPYTLPMQASAHYYTGANMTGTEIPGGTVINSTQTVYLHVDNGSNCVADLHYIINIGQPTG